MRQRDLSSTLPSPSELDDYHKCPCYWYLKDRLWITPKKDKWPLLFGRIIDRLLNDYLEGGQAKTELKDFDAIVKRQETEDEDFEAFALSTRNALIAWLAKYGVIKENVIAVQPKINAFKANMKIDYIVRDEAGQLIVRERKLVSPFTSFEDEMEKYELGMQPICYASGVEQEMHEPVSHIEFDFLFRSAPVSGRYKEIPAQARRGQVFVEQWKKDLWRNTAEFTNYCMRTLEESLNESFNFNELPRHTGQGSCIVKYGKKSYPCDFYACCKVNLNPLLMPDAFDCDLQEKKKDV